MDFVAILKEAGIAGAGGAGFPTYAKQSAGQTDTLVINGAECEPLLFTDFTLLRERLADVVAGGEALAALSGMKRVVLAVEKKKAAALGLAHGASLAARTTVAVLPDVFPMGDEVGLIWETTGRLVRPGQLPATAGVTVQNVETVLNIFGALESGRPVTRKWVTVAGAIPHCYVGPVPVGTPVRELFASLGVEVPPDCAVFDGGPAMGRVVEWDSAVVKKTTNALTVLPRQSEAYRKSQRTSQGNRGIAVTACCQCTRCTDLCPRHLLGYPLEPHKMVLAAAAGRVDPVLVTGATLCCGCGVCETVACPQGISPKMIIGDYKTLLRAEKLAYRAPEGQTFAPSPERNWRLVPGERMAALLGAGKYVKTPRRIPEGYMPRRVEIPLAGHIGRPSEPCVAAGDRVEEGQVIATAAEGLSLPQHASLSGRVLAVSGGRIIIERD